MGGHFPRGCFGASAPLDGADLEFDRPEAGTRRRKIANIGKIGSTIDE